MRQFAFTSVVAGVLLAIVPGSQAATAPNNAVPRTHTLLYYRMGGGDPAARAANPSAVAVHLGIGAALKLNYSCGKFDIGLSWSTLMNNFAHLGQQVTAAVHAGIAALPLYILQRAQPGLYEIFQTYSVKADKVINAALESCQQMEAQIKAGQDPYAQWAGLAKGEGWMDQANTPNSDIVATKTAGKHTGVNCEACHGPLAKHADDPSITPAKLDTAVLCVKCHEASAAKPKGFPQVKGDDHSGGLACDTCHKPHDPAIAAGGAK